MCTLSCIIKKAEIRLSILKEIRHLSEIPTFIAVDRQGGIMKLVCGGLDIVEDQTMDCFEEIAIIFRPCSGWRVADNSEATKNLYY